MTVKMRAEIAKWTTGNGCHPAARKYEIAESTIWGFTTLYKKEQADGKDLEVIPLKKHGGYKLLLEEIGKKVINLMKEIQSPGAAMS